MFRISIKVWRNGLLLFSKKDSLLYKAMLSLTEKVFGKSILLSGQYEVLWQKQFRLVMLALFFYHIDGAHVETISIVHTYLKR